ncbi:hypothetical protein KSZ_74740 [Dictyobacter formicarum]|uniref:Uncharacterized protein n=1 Tax=Dictyobacter formicarum TaxID=2778368 RepID=A0ABQ3VV85_9CHLR|nr:hypothetical protein KSZ_74740 [Dictyobacter formicarum]
MPRGCLSSDRTPYAVEREVEDIDAVIAEAGGSACVFGGSSGAVPALEAARLLGGKIEKLTLYPRVAQRAKPK